MLAVNGNEFTCEPHGCKSPSAFLPPSQTPTADSEGFVPPPHRYRQCECYDALQASRVFEVLLSVVNAYRANGPLRVRQEPVTRVLNLPFAPLGTV
jgi:hypothetical protein